MWPREIHLTVVICLVGSIFVAIVTVNKDFEMEAAKALRSQIKDDDHVKVPTPTH